MQDNQIENIIINKKKNKITLLDWREDFSGLNSYGDIYYDLAKINHGLIIDHNIIKSSLYKINIHKYTCISFDEIKIIFFFYQKRKVVQDPATRIYYSVLVIRFYLHFLIYKNYLKHNLFFLYL